MHMNRTKVVNTLSCAAGHNLGSTSTLSYLLNTWKRSLLLHLEAVVATSTLSYWLNTWKRSLLRSSTTSPQLPPANRGGNNAAAVG